MLPALLNIDLGRVVNCIVGNLNIYKDKHNVIGIDEDSEIIVNFADAKNDGEWDEHFGFKSADSVDFWNEDDLKPHWDRRELPFLENDIRTSINNVGKWMHNSS